jgi:hypothetical protein
VSPVDSLSFQDRKVINSFNHCAKYYLNLHFFVYQLTPAKVISVIVITNDYYQTNFIFHSAVFIFISMFHFPFFLFSFFFVFHFLSCGGNTGCQNYTLIVCFHKNNEVCLNVFFALMPNMLLGKSLRYST